MSNAHDPNEGVSSVGWESPSQNWDFIDPNRQAAIQARQAEDAERVPPTAAEIRAYIEMQEKSAAQRLDEEKINETCSEWVASNPAYLVSQHSAANMQEYLDARKLTPTPETL